MPIARRRSISIDKFNDDAINDFRASAIRRGLDIDYTTIFNMLVEYGIRKLREVTTANIIDPILVEVSKKYWSYDELKECGLVDEWKDFQEFKEWKQKQTQTSTQISSNASHTTEPKYIS